MKLFFTDIFELPLPEEHRFPMEKYRLLRERVAASDRFPVNALSVPPAATDAELATVHIRTSWTSTSRPSDSPVMC